MKQALGYYGGTAEAYSDKRWLDLLTTRFGSVDAAQHLLKAFDASARINPELCALSWVPMDLGTSRQLMLPYWYWTDEAPRWDYFTSPSRGTSLLPLRHYAKVVAKLGATYRDNSGADYNRNLNHPGAQEYIWGLGTYPTTPEAQMRRIRKLGEESLREAEEAMKSISNNRAEAETIYNYMKAYKLLTDYYEQKVTAAATALIYSFGGGQQYREEAERHADQAVELYGTAINFIWDNIDKKKGDIKGRWEDKVYTLPELIAREREERAQLAKLFKWPTD
jgi:hypothetical protein